MSNDILVESDSVSLTSRISARVTLKNIEADALLAKTLGERQATEAGTYDQDVHVQVDTVFLSGSHGVRRPCCAAKS